MSVVAGSVGPTMTSTLDPLPLSDADDPAGLLAYARAQKQDEDDAAREVFKAAAAWASMHSLDSRVGPVGEWHESAVAAGWARGVRRSGVRGHRSPPRWAGPPESGRRYLAPRGGCYRLTAMRARLDGGELPACRLRSSPGALCLSQEAAGWWRGGAPVANKIGPAHSTG